MNIDASIVYEETYFNSALEESAKQFALFHHKIETEFKEVDKVSISPIDTDSFQVTHAGIVLRIELWIKWEGKDEYSSTVMCYRVNPATGDATLVDSLTWNGTDVNAVQFNDESVSFVEYGAYVLKFFIRKSYTPEVVEEIW